VSGRRVLHLVNLAGGPAELFLPPLRERGFTVEDVNPNLEPLPESVAGYAALLATGGLLYTVGAVVYARRRPDPAPRVFGYHEVFHALVIAAAAVHFAAIAFVAV